MIISTFLKDKIPEEIYSQFKCFILHPGPMGDRGPSSLDWAIWNKKKVWGVTVVEAHKEMDHGDIYSSRNFIMPEDMSKSMIYNSHV